MSKNVVVYKSKYGYTAKYAKWIATELGADLFEKSQIKANDLKKYDCIIYGGGLYAGGIIGSSLINNAYDSIKDKKIAVFTVGLADPQTTDYQPIINKNFTPQMVEHIKFFHFRGGIDYKNISFLHKTMMSMLVSSVKKIDEDKKTDEQKEMVATFGQVVDFCDINTTAPLIDYCKQKDESKLSSN